MAQSKIRKGFFFYFGLFVLLLVAVFLVCLVIMMFNPGASVLWMKYFTPKEEVVSVKKLTDTNEDVSYVGVNGLTVKCDYANVIVTTNNDFQESGIKIINKARGFTGAKNAKDFGYTLTRAGDELVLDVQEPTGFLFFSKQIDVLLYSKADWAFGNNFKLKVESEGNCNVEFGRDKANEGDTKVHELDIKTGKGNVIFRDTCDTSAMTGGVKISTGSGKIGAMSTSFGALTDVELSTTSGKINFDTLNVGSNNISISSTKGSVAINNIFATKAEITCERGNFYFKKVSGDIDFTKAIDKIIEPNIVIDEIQGNFRLASSDKKVSPEINIGKITGTLFVAAKNGKLNVKEALGAIDVESTESLAENIVVGESNLNNIRLINVRGLLKIGFKGVVSSNVNLTNKSAKIEVNFTKVARFNTLARTSGDEEVPNGKITISIADQSINYNADKKCELSVLGTSGTTGNINLVTDSNIVYNLKDAVA